MAAQPRLLAHLSAAGVGVSGTQLARHWVSSMQVVPAMQRATAQLPGALTHLVLGGNKAGAAAGTAAAGWVVGLGLVVVGLVTHMALQVLLSSWHTLPLAHSIRAQPLRAQGLVGAAAAGVAAWIGMQEGRQVTGSCTHRVPDLQRTAAQRLNPQEGVVVVVVVSTAAAWTGAQVALQVLGSSTHRVPEMQRTAAQPLVPHEAGVTSAAAVVGCLGAAVALQEDLQVQGSTLHV
jgi:hypothetical protein